MHITSSADIWFHLSRWSSGPGRVSRAASGPRISSSCSSQTLDGRGLPHTRESSGYTRGGSLRSATSCCREPSSFFPLTTWRSRSKRRPFRRRRSAVWDLGYSADHRNRRLMRSVILRKNRLDCCVREGCAAEFDGERLRGVRVVGRLSVHPKPIASAVYAVFLHQADEVISSLVGRPARTDGIAVAEFGCDGARTMSSDHLEDRLHRLIGPNVRRRIGAR